MRFRVRGLYFSSVDRHMLWVWKRRERLLLKLRILSVSSKGCFLTWFITVYTQQIYYCNSQKGFDLFWIPAGWIDKSCRGRPPLSFTSLMCASNELLGNTTNYCTSVFIWSTWNYPFCHWQNVLPAMGSNDSSQQHVWHSLTTKQQENQ